MYFPQWLTAALLLIFNLSMQVSSENRCLGCFSNWIQVLPNVRRTSPLLCIDLELSFDTPSLWRGILVSWRRQETVNLVLQINHPSLGVPVGFHSSPSIHGAVTAAGGSSCCFASLSGDRDQSPVFCDSVHICQAIRVLVWLWSG